MTPVKNNGAGMERYLDTGKSVIISSPAGSGKTEKLARRYIALLKAGSGVEKILAITFTEKAASEMKERILDILAREELELYEGIMAKVPLMRISTIHSFCLKVLKRFSVELGLDPSLSVADELTAGSLWTEAVYDAITAEKESPALFFEMMKERGIRGGDALMGLLGDLHAKRPRPELMLKEGHVAEGDEEKKILAVYADCLERYRRKKIERHLLDFNDLEVLAYEALSGGPEWHNVLYAFDEHTDHLLVDEFQDTSTLQWKIIDKLTEEWRSGMGPKREAGKTPTIFLVGDEKQSIYLFRGANVSVFERAKERFSGWLGAEYRFEEVKENYRSLPAIVDFANRLFGKLMPPELLESWRTKYSPFEAVREGEGRVELVLIEGSSSTKLDRAREAGVLAKAIAGLKGSYGVYDGGSKRPCKFSDMVVLLRKRTHLGVFEDAFRKEGVPFVVQKGIGFFDETETALLREFVSFIVDPADDYSLFCLLRSPVFGFDHKKLQKLMEGETPLLKKLGAEKWGAKAHGLITNLLKRSASVPLSVLIEEMLTETGGWAHFWERQRHANIKKFIGAIEADEAEGRAPLEIREKLIRQRRHVDVPKANINAEEMEAVRIMTVHAAKGLQFPMVFIPSMEEANFAKSSMLAIDDEPECITLRYEPDSKKRKGKEPFERLRQKELEEEKRLFYVAVTRAMDYLCMIGSVGDKTRNKAFGGRLAYIDEAFGLKEANGLRGADGLTVVSEKDIEALRGKAGAASFEDAGFFMDEPSYTAPIQLERGRRWLGVTEELDVRARHGEDWVVIGSVMHRLFEELSRGVIKPEDVKRRASSVLGEEAFGGEDLERIMGVIDEDMGKLSKSGYLGEIILPSQSSYSELPFHMEKGGSVFKGRMDRMLIRDGIALIYDYKTFPVGERELPELVEKYRFQLEIYKEATEKIFGLPARAYLLFTHVPSMLEV